MHWKTNTNTYNVSLVKDTRTVENGCMIREGLVGSGYAGWVGPVDATTSMSDQHNYGAMSKVGDVETPNNNAQKWIRLGTCQVEKSEVATKKQVIHKQYSTSVMVLPGYEW